MTPRKSRKSRKLARSRRSHCRRAARQCRPCRRGTAERPKARGLSSRPPVSVSFSCSKLTALSPSAQREDRALVAGHQARSPAFSCTPGRRRLRALPPGVPSGTKPSASGLCVDCPGRLLAVVSLLASQHRRGLQHRSGKGRHKSAYSTAGEACTPPDRWRQARDLIAPWNFSRLSRAAQQPE